MSNFETNKTELLWKWSTDNALDTIQSKPIWESGVLKCAGSCIVTDCLITAVQIGCRSKQIHLLSQGRKQDVCLTIRPARLMMFYWWSASITQPVQQEPNSECLLLRQWISFYFILWGFVPFVSPNPFWARLLLQRRGCCIYSFNRVSNCCIVSRAGPSIKLLFATGNAQYTKTPLKVNCHRMQFTMHLWSKGTKNVTLQLTLRLTAH